MSISHPYQFTLNLLKNLIDSAPITFDKTRKNEMLAAHDRLLADLTVENEEIENNIIAFGTEVWPYREAYQKLYENYGRAEEEDGLKKLLSNELKPKYEKFLLEKGNIERIRGTPVVFDLYFTADERAEIVQAELTAHDKVHKALERLILGEKQEEYARALEEFTKKQKEIEATIQELRALAERGEKWKSEILDKARMFESGFGYLERPVTLEDVKGEIDYYLGVLGIGEE